MSARAGSPLRVRGPSPLRSRHKTFGSVLPEDLVLKYATNLWRARSYQGNGPWRDEKAGLIAQKGAAGQAAITADGLWLPDSSGDNCRIADAGTMFDGATDFEYVVHAKADSWGSHGDNQGLGAVWGVNGNQWRLIVLSGGSLYIGVHDGTAERSASAAGGLTEGQAHWFRVTYDGTNGAVYAQPDAASEPTSWGAAIASFATGTGGIANNIAGPFQVGDYGSAGDSFRGTIYSAVARVNGSDVASPDFAAATPGALSFDDAQSNTWTVNQSADGSDDPTFLDYAGTKWVQGTPGGANNYVYISSTQPDTDSDTLSMVIRNADEGTNNDARHTWNGSRRIGYLSGDVTTSVRFRDNGGTTRINNHTIDTETVKWVRITWVATTNDMTTTVETSNTDTEDVDAVVWGTPDEVVESVNTYYTTFDGLLATGPRLGYFDATATDCSFTQGLFYVGGVLVADFNVDRDFSDHSTLTSSTTGETWTFNRDTAATGLKLEVVTADDFAYDGADFFEFVPPSWLGAADEDFTIFVPFRSHSQPTGDAQLFYAWQSVGSTEIQIKMKSTANSIESLVRQSGTALVQEITSVAIHDSDLHVAVLRRTYGSDIDLFIDSSSTNNNDTDTLTGLTTLTGARIGARGDTTQFLNGRVPTALLANSSLTDAQIDAVCAQLIARNS